MDAMNGLNQNRTFRFLFQTVTLILVSHCIVWWQQKVCLGETTTTIKEGEKCCLYQICPELLKFKYSFTAPSAWDKKYCNVSFKCTENNSCNIFQIDETKIQDRISEKQTDLVEDIRREISEIKMGCICLNVDRALKLYYN